MKGGPRGGAGFNPYGGMGGFQVGGERVEKALEYIPIGQLDEAAKKGKFPAMTVIPLRMITIHAEVPLKTQIDEIRRALRLPNATEAAKWGPYYDGYDVRRRISFVKPDGTPELIQDWTDYDFEEQYRLPGQRAPVGRPLRRGTWHFALRCRWSCRCRKWSRARTSIRTSG